MESKTSNSKDPYRRKPGAATWLLRVAVLFFVVVGLPVMLDGHEGEKAAWVRDYAAALQEHLHIPVAFTDEAFTTVQAENSLRARGQKGRKIRQNVDAVAATLILQAYLDMQAGAFDA